MIESTLEKIGLTQGEIKVYLSLLELGTSSSGAIIKKSKISGSKIYEVLDRLAEKGLVNTMTKNNVKFFESATPDRILQYLDEKKEDIDQEKKEVEQIIPQLILKQQHQPKSEVKLYTGWEGMKTANEDIYKSLKRGEEWLEMGLSDQPKQWEHYFNKKQEERAKKGIVYKAIINEEYKSLHIHRKKLSHTEFRFLSKEFKMPISTQIYANKISIFVLMQEAPTVIIIENKFVADSFRKYFEHLWKNSRE